MKVFSQDCDRPLIEETRPAPSWQRRGSKLAAVSERRANLELEFLVLVAGVLDDR
jgi:hypothetical protein